MKVKIQILNISLQTARHVLYNTDVAEETKVGLFYESESCVLNGIIESLWAHQVISSDPSRDVCKVVCITHDENLVEQIKSARGIFCYMSRTDNFQIYFNACIYIK